MLCQFFSLSIVKVNKHIMCVICSLTNHAKFDRDWISLNEKYKFLQKLVPLWPWNVVKVTNSGYSGFWGPASNKIMQSLKFITTIVSNWRNGNI